MVLIATLTQFAMLLITGQDRDKEVGPVLYSWLDKEEWIAYTNERAFKEGQTTLFLFWIDFSKNDSWIFLVCIELF